MDVILFYSYSSLYVKVVMGEWLDQVLTHLLSSLSNMYSLKQQYIFRQG